MWSYADSESVLSVIGIVQLLLVIFKDLRRLCRNIASFAASVIAIDSASIVDNATQLCLLAVKIFIENEVLKFIFC